MSDSSPKPWTIRGVPQEARETAIEAATRADLDLGPWVAHAIRQTAASDRGGLAGEVIPSGQSDTPSDRSSMEVVAMLTAGLGQIGETKGCGGVAERMRLVLDQHLARLALEPLPPRRAGPKPKLLTPPSSEAG